MTHRHPGPKFTRRTALRRLGLAGLGAALGLTTRLAPAAAEDQAPHPMIGHWLAVTPLGPAHVVFEPGGAVVMAWPHSEDIERGTFSYTTAAAGFWQPVSAHGIHFAVVQLDTAVGGGVLGTTSLESIVVVSADGGSFASGGVREQLTVWDSVGMTQLVLREEPAVPAMSGIRMWPEAEAGAG